MNFKERDLIQVLTREDWHYCDNKTFRDHCTRPKCYLYIRYFHEICCLDTAANRCQMMR